MWLCIIYKALVCKAHCQRQIRILYNRKASWCSSNVVVCGYINVFFAFINSRCCDLHGCCICNCSFVRAADFRPLRRVRYIVRMAAHQANPRPVVRRYGCQLNLASRILLRCRLACECYRTLLDRQLARYRRDRVVRRHVFRSVHDLVSIRDRVVPICSIRYVRCASCSFCHQLITCKQLSGCYGHCAVRER